MELIRYKQKEIRLISLLLLCSCICVHSTSSSSAEKRLAEGDKAARAVSELLSAYLEALVGLATDVMRFRVLWDTSSATYSVFRDFTEKYV